MVHRLHTKCRLTHDTTYDPLVEEPLSGGAHNSLRVPRPDPPLLPSLIFPLGPPFCGDQCRAERALGCGGIFPRGQQAGARGRKRRREGNEWAARVGRRYTIQRTIRWLSRTAVRWGPQFSSSAPPRSPRPLFPPFPLWPLLRSCPPPKSTL